MTSQLALGGGRRRLAHLAPPWRPREREREEKGNNPGIRILVVGG